MAGFSKLLELETIHSTDSESEPTEISGTFNSLEIPASESTATSQVKHFLNQFQSPR